MSVWKSHNDLMQRLTTAQNHPANRDRDVMTWASMCGSREELEAHVVRVENFATSYVAPIRRRRAA